MNEPSNGFHNESTIIDHETSKRSIYSLEKGSSKISSKRKNYSIITKKKFQNNSGRIVSFDKKKDWILVKYEKQLRGLRFDEEELKRDIEKLQIEIKVAGRMKGKRRKEMEEREKSNRYKVYGYVNEKALGIDIPEDIYKMKNSEVENENEILIKKIQKYEIEKTREEGKLQEVKEMDTMILKNDIDRLDEVRHLP